MAGSSGWFRPSSSAASDEGVSSLIDSLWSTVTGDEKYDLQDKRVTVLQLHIKELNKQAQEHAKELSAAKSAIREYEAKAKAHAPMERKLFAKLETTQAELRKAREAKRRAEIAAQAQADELAALLADRGHASTLRVTNDGPAEGEQPGASASAVTPQDAHPLCPTNGNPGVLLLRATALQLDATKAQLRDAEAAIEELELRARHSEAALRRSEDDAKRAHDLHMEMEKKVSVHLAKAAASADLTLPPPTKGGDLETQFHILQLNFRHVSAELARKSALADGLTAQRDGLVVKLMAAEAASKASREALRVEARERADKAARRIGALSEDLKRQAEALQTLITEIEEGPSARVAASAAVEAAAGMVRKAAASAVREGALRGAIHLATADSSEQRKALAAALHSVELSEVAASEAAAALTDARTSAAEAARASDAKIALVEASVRDLEARLHHAELTLEEERAEAQRHEQECASLQAKLGKVQAEAAAAAAEVSSLAARTESEAKANEQRVAQAALVSSQLDEERRVRAEEAEAAKAARAEAMALRKELAEAKRSGSSAVVEAAAAAAKATEEARMELEAVRAAADKRVEEALEAGRAEGRAEATASANAEAAAEQQRLEAELAATRSELEGRLATKEAEAVAHASAAVAEARAEGEKRARKAEEMAEAARTRAEALAEELVHERLARQEMAEHLADMANGSGTDGELQRKLAEARDACAKAKGELAALSVQATQSQTQVEAARRAEADASRRANAAEARIRALTSEMQAVRAQYEGQQKAASAQRSEQLAQAKSREAQWSTRHSELQQEAAALRNAMAQQQEWAASQIDSLKEALRRAQAAAGTSPAGASHASNDMNELLGIFRASSNGEVRGPVDLMDAPNMPSPNGGDGVAWGQAQVAAGAEMGGSAIGGNQVESLRAQLALAQQRAAAAAEYRELSEGWKRKAERLTESLAEAKENAEAQAIMWKEQLQAVRVRARAEQRRASELEEQVVKLGGSVSRQDHSHPADAEFTSPMPTAPRIRSRGELGSRSGANARASPDDGAGPQLGANDRHESRRMSSGRSSSDKSLREGVGRLMKGVDGRLDGVFDKMDGLAARLKRGTGSLRERLVTDDDRD